MTTLRLSDIEREAVVRFIELKDCGFGAGKAARIVLDWMRVEVDKLPDGPSIPVVPPDLSPSTQGEVRFAQHLIEEASKRRYAFDSANPGISERVRASYAASLQHWFDEEFIDRGFHDMWNGPRLVVGLPWDERIR